MRTKTHKSTPFLSIYCQWIPRGINQLHDFTFSETQTKETMKSSRKTKTTTLKVTVTSERAIMRELRKDAQKRLAKELQGPINQVAKASKTPVEFLVYHVLRAANAQIQANGGRMTIPFNN
jgi:hypothetical protein